MNRFYIVKAHDLILCDCHSLSLLWCTGSPPPEVELEIDGDPPKNQQEEERKREKEREATMADGSALSEKESESVDGGGLFDPEPPVGILKKSSYVSGEETETQELPVTDNSGKKGRKPRRKLVPVWRLVSR